MTSEDFEPSALHKLVMVTDNSDQHLTCVSRIQEMRIAKPSVVKKILQRMPLAGTILPRLALVLVFGYEVSAQLANVSISVQVL